MGDYLFLALEEMHGAYPIVMSVHSVLYITAVVLLGFGQKPTRNPSAI